ncbi:MAG TPA: hypothetical protein VFE19_14830 [Jatrophihabitantaceae bacterium]|jgi:hypothetical protein|nr:hypothetical protein [Jatrophihabitantaceae bacterium]
MLSGREVELAALGSPSSTILWPIALMVAGVAVLALIGHFVFRRESHVRRRPDFEIVDSFELFEGFEGFERPGELDSAAAHHGATGPRLVQ